MPGREGRGYSAQVVPAWLLHQPEELYQLHPILGLEVNLPARS
jgi:hypothetical protein